MYAAMPSVIRARAMSDEKSDMDAPGRMPVRGWAMRVAPLVVALRPGCRGVLVRGMVGAPAVCPCCPVGRVVRPRQYVACKNGADGAP
eukprot:75085-Pyramimonas_sp.AAC.1